MKYKIGDKVKINWSGDSTITGEVGTIYACDEANGYLVKLDNKNIEHRNRGYFLTEDLEPYPQTNRQWLESLSDEEQGITISELFDEWYLGFHYEPKTITDIFAAWFTKWLQAERTTV